VETDAATLEQLRERKQSFFLPYYREIVDEHPEGIAAKVVKQIVSERLRREFGIDVFDPQQTGLNASTGDSRASQWANNLISNGVLDEYMLVVRGSRAMLYPGAIDNSRPIPQAGGPLGPAEVSLLDERKPSWMEARSGLASRRSLQLAEYIRGLGGRACAVQGSRCAVFEARDGHPYVEVHHVIPMAMQSRTDVNLDRSTNMVPLCPGCHACLHRGATPAARLVLNEVLAWFESIHHETFESCNHDIIFDITADGLLGIYGADI
jgi:hypothetical protein